MESYLSLVSIYGQYLRHVFISAGLRRQSISIDGGETVLYFWKSTLNEGPKPTLVLIQGFGPEPTWQWSHQVRSFSPNFNLVVPELVFFGDSTTRSSRRTEIFQAECIVKLLDSIGAGKFYAVGTSYGGFVAYHVGRICGVERVEKVVIASSDLLKRGGDNDLLMERADVKEIEDLILPKTAGMVRSLIKLAVYRPPPSWIPDFIFRDLIKTLYAENRAEKVELMKGITLGKSDGLERLSQEILIVWGEHDNIFPLEKAHKIKEIGEKVVLKVIKETGHLPQTEKPEQFNATVENFLLGDDNPKSSLSV